MTGIELVAVAAISDNLVVGDGPDIPWESLPEDREQYRALVADAPVVLGRRTFELMRADLPGRTQVVLSRSERAYDVETARVVGSAADAIAAVTETGADTAYVLGGATVYELFLPFVDRMVLTRVPGEYDGTARYPEWDAADWRRVAETPYDGFTVQEWERTTSPERPSTDA